jgi:hypothetical protein
MHRETKLIILKLKSTALIFSCCYGFCQILLTPLVSVALTRLSLLLPLAVWNKIWLNVPLRYIRCKYGIVKDKGISFYSQLHFRAITVHNTHSYKSSSFFLKPFIYVTIRHKRNQFLLTSFRVMRTEVQRPALESLTAAKTNKDHCLHNILTKWLRTLQPNSLGDNLQFLYFPIEYST